MRVLLHRPLEQVSEKGDISLVLLVQQVADARVRRVRAAERTRQLGVAVEELAEGIPPLPVVPNRRARLVRPELRGAQAVLPEPPDGRHELGPLMAGDEQACNEADGPHSQQCPLCRGGAIALGERHDHDAGEGGPDDRSVYPAPDQVEPVDMVGQNFEVQGKDERCVQAQDDEGSDRGDVCLVDEYEGHRDPDGAPGRLHPPRDAVARHLRKRIHLERKHAGCDRKENEEHA
mmetsp:Transcript_42989/g.89919  ORF Transcript_42989/g.89919 Transcript_42989/m.89919 type:complete len:233 (-) Transcript_42989:578-1276(-)